MKKISKCVYFLYLFTASIAWSSDDISNQNSSSTDLLNEQVIELSDKETQKKYPFYFLSKKALDKILHHPSVLALTPEQIENKLYIVDDKGDSNSSSKPNNPQDQFGLSPEDRLHCNTIKQKVGSLKDTKKAKRKAYQATEEYKAYKKAYRAKNNKQKGISDLTSNDMSNQNSSNSLDKSMNQSDNDDNDFQVVFDGAGELDNNQINASQQNLYNKNDEPKTNIQDMDIDFNGDEIDAALQESLTNEQDEGNSSSSSTKNRSQSQFGLSPEDRLHCQTIKQKVLKETGSTSEANKAYNKAYNVIYKSTEEYKAKQRAYLAKYLANHPESKSKQAAHNKAYQAKKTQNGISDSSSNDMSNQNSSNYLDQNINQSDNSSSLDNPNLVENDFQVVFDGADEFDHNQLYTNYEIDTALHQYLTNEQGEFISFLDDTSSSSKPNKPQLRLNLSPEDLLNCNKIKQQVFDATGDLSEAYKAYFKAYNHIYQSNPKYKAKRKAYLANHSESKSKQAAYQKAYRAKNKKQRGISDSSSNDMSTQSSSNSLDQNINQSDNSSSSYDPDLVENDFQVIFDGAGELDNNQINNLYNKNDEPKTNIQDMDDMDIDFNGELFD